MARVAVVGAGAMGLAAAYHAVRAGHQVTVFEADKIPGGMAAHFDFGGLSIERYYHFVCKTDRPTFDLMAELGIAHKMCWARTSMGFFFDGRLYDWGNPHALLRFPRLSLSEKLRYGLMMFLAVRRGSPGRLEERSAREWIEAWCGGSVYAQVWKPLFDLKFYDFADAISASWIWARIKRLGSSRESMMQEVLGYIDGGTEVLIQALVKEIESRGGTVRLGSPVSEVVISDGRVTGVRTGATVAEAEAVISTVPLPLVPGMIPDLPDSVRRAYESIDNIGVACLVFKVRRSVTPHFWVNVADERMGIPGFVEFSHLRPTPERIIFVPYYMPTTHRRWAMTDAELLAEAFGYLKMVNPDLSDADLIDCKVGRLKHAQPICPPGFSSRLPSVQTPITGLQIADTCFYYPEDRGISESVRYGRLLARGIDDPTVWRART